jgi:hypothetical protein
MRARPRHELKLQPSNRSLAQFRVTPGRHPAPGSRSWLSRPLPFRRAWAGLGLLLLLVALSGCVRLPSKQPKGGVASLQLGTNATGAVTPTALQAEVMRFADEYSIIVAQEADDLAVRVGTMEARQFAARIKVGQGHAAIINAAGQNPAVNALDMVVLASVARMVAEDYVVGQRFGAAAMPMLETSRRMESNAWSLVRTVLKPEQRQELRELIQEWRRQHPDQRYVGAVRFREFAVALGREPQRATAKPTSVFSLLFLDPMSGLDPTVRAVEETRYLAERALFHAQRMPVLVSWQAEFLALQLADQPASRQLLTNADHLSASLQSFARTAGQLPGLIDRQRDAAIQQLFAGIAVERSNILASLASEEIKMRELLAETRGALEAGGVMATNVNAAIQSLDAFVRFVAPPKTNLVANPSATHRRPFDVLDYGTAAGQVGGMARDLNVLLTSVNQSMPQAAQLGQQTAARVEKAVARGFWLGLVLILVLLAGAVLAGLAYRILANKLAPHEAGHVVSKP